MATPGVEAASNGDAAGMYEKTGAGRLLDLASPGAQAVPSAIPDGLYGSPVLQLLFCIYLC
jgi:hypothetical protein